MKRVLILCLVLFFGKNAGDCATTFFPPLKPVANAINNEFGNNLSSNYPDPYSQPVNMNYPAINNIERSLFGHAYEHQDIKIRLSRIERSLFTTTYPNSPNIQRIDNIISNYNQMNKYPNVSSNEISKLEARVFGQTYLKNTPERRLERLETQLLGATQSGDLNSRLNLLKSAAQSYNIPTANQPQTNTGWKGITRALGSAILGGSMTGFTPAISPYDNLNTNYAYNNYNAYNNGFRPFTNGFSGLNQNLSPGYGIYRGVRTNNGYYDGFQSFGNGTSVTILD